MLQVADENAPDRVGQSLEVRHLRQILLWPVQLLPIEDGGNLQHWERLSDGTAQSPWREVDDEFGDPTEFQGRHYNEFVTFLPPVQRFLYGQGMGQSVRRIYGESPIKVMRRSDVATARVTLSRGSKPIDLRIVHTDLYFFFDINIAILALEVAVDDLDLRIAQETLFRFGRAYPAYWEEDRRGGHCPWLVEWLSPSGEILARSDYDKREKYLSFVCQHRAPAVAAHWEFLLSPMVLYHSDRSGPVRYRQLEYYRMPYMAFFAMENGGALTRGDLVRLGIGNDAPRSTEPPFSDSYVTHFEKSFCRDRYGDMRLITSPTDAQFMCTGRTLVVVGQAEDKFFMDDDGGFLGRFRHQHFLLFLVAHFHRAALHMFSDRLIAAVSRLETGDPESGRAFRQEIHDAEENFLRFEHRYWFHEISNQAQARELFGLARQHLDLDALYREIREELQDMGNFLEVEAMRRQNETVVRLTVVTTFGLIGTVTTGFLGMNILAWAEQPTNWRIMVFTAILAATSILTFYTVVKSRRLSEFLDSLSDEQEGWWEKVKALRSVWLKRHSRRR